MIGVRDRSNILSSETMSCLRGDRQSIFKSNRSDKRIADLDQKRLIPFGELNLYEFFLCFDRCMERIFQSI